MNRFKNNQYVNGEKDGQADINRLGLKTLLDVNIQADSTATARSRRVDEHHGADKQQQTKGDLTTSIGEKVVVQTSASEQFYPNSLFDPLLPK